MKKKLYAQELEKLQLELVYLQEWIKEKGKKVAVIFEGKDSAGKGGVIKRITESLNPRSCRVVALPKPTDRESGQWYFQRYVNQLPAEGEIVLFDRSWYNRAVVEPVMGYCTKEDTENFYETCPTFEKMLIQNDIILIKYWLEISKEEQEKRLRARIQEPAKTWKFSENDLKAYTKWDEFNSAEFKMFQHTNTEISPWNFVDANNKKKTRLNIISHLLSQFDYYDIPNEKIVLPDRSNKKNEWIAVKIPKSHFIKNLY